MAAACFYLAAADLNAARGTAAALQAAVRAAPFNALYYERLAKAIEWEGDDGTSHFRRALALNPRLTSASIRVALAAERDGELGRAEQILLNAAATDRTFDPRWALMNFYFRHEREPEFWHWTQAVLDRLFGDGRIVFELAARMPDGDRRLDALIPNGAESLARYLAWRIGTSQPQYIEHGALKLAALRRAEDQNLLLAASTRLIDAGDGKGAWRVFSSVVTPSGNLIADPNFENGLNGAGFYWRSNGCPAVSLQRAAAPESIRIETQGAIPDQCDLLTQPVWVPRAGRQRLRYELRGRAEGLEWRWCRKTTCAVLPVPPGGSEPWNTAEAEVDAPSEGLYSLVLGYHRPTGVSRFEGEFGLREVSLVAR